MKARTVKFIFLSLALILMVVMFLWPSKQEDRLSLSTTMQISEDDIQLTPSEVEGVTSTVMEGPQFSGEDEKGRRWSLKANEAIQKLSDGIETLSLNVVQGATTLENGKEIKFKSGLGVLQSTSQTLALTGDVKVMGYGYTLKTSDLKGDLNKFNIQALNKIHITSANGFLEAGSFEYRADKAYSVFNKGIEMRLISAFQGIKKKLPLDISSKRMRLFQSEEKAVFEGNVKVKRGGATLGSDKLEVLYGSGTAKNDIKEITALGHVIIVDGESTATGGKAYYTPKLGKVLLTENVVLTQGDTVLTGKNLTYNLETGDMSFNNKGEEKGRVKAIFIIKGKD